MLVFYLSLLENQEDKDRFTEVYETYRKVMFYVANQILENEDLAEDAVHSAFVRIIKNFHKINEKDRHKTMGFVVTIVRNVARSMVKKRSKEILQEDPLIGGSQVQESPEAEIEAKDTAKRLLDLLNQMKPDHQEILELVYYHGLKIVEAAEVLEISAPLARKRLQRAKEELRALLKKEGMNYDEI